MNTPDVRGKVHVSNVGTYHPAPNADVAWTAQDLAGEMREAVCAIGSV